MEGVLWGSLKAWGQSRSTRTLDLSLDEVVGQEGRACGSLVWAMHAVGPFTKG